MMSYNLPPVSGGEAGCFAATVVLLAFIILINLALLAAGAWVVIWVAQQMGVL